MGKKFLIAFASPDLELSIPRFYEQAKKMNFYDEIIVFKISDLDMDSQKLIFELLKKGKKNGYGYWFWKPLIIYQTLNKIEYEDLVNYTDIGCHFNQAGVDKLEYYVKQLMNSNKGILGFQYFPLKGFENDEFEFPDISEFKYTKADLLNYFNVMERKDIINSPQYWAGNIFLIKNKFSIEFIKKWINVFEKRFDLIDDTPSKIDNYESFISNKHDQSVYSILCKLNGIDSISAYECEWFYHKGLRYWDHTIKNPIIARRDKKYNIFRRFLNRQKRTFNRYYNKYFNN